MKTFTLDQVINGIQFTELSRNDGNESGQESGGGENWTATRVFATKWNAHLPFVIEMLGGVTAAGVFTPAQTYPDISSLIAKSYSAVGLGTPFKGGNDMIDFPFAEVTINYELPGAGGTQTQLTESLVISAEVLTMPQGAFTFVNGNSVFDDDGSSIGSITATTALIDSEQPGRLMPEAGYIMRLEKEPNPPWSDILGLSGKVNNAAFTPIDITFATGTLLFSGTSSERQLALDPTTGNNIDVWTMSYNFAFRRIPWNLVFNADSVRGKVGWSQVVDDSGNTILKPGNFALLTP